ncbi:FTR1 family protein [bacterium]|nr:FTR1 family protein [bacterium]MCB2179208.1 FTR1 family protein [bacterium]
MVPALLLSFREGLEAALIIGILLGTLKRIERPEFRGSVWTGAGAAVTASILAAFILQWVGASFEGAAEEAFEGITMLLSAAILTWVILWMQRQSHTINTQLSSDVRKAAIAGSKGALFSLAFLAIIREGLELVLILTAASYTSGQYSILIGTGIGLAVAVLIAYLLFNRLIKLNLGQFFRITSIILILFAAGLVAHGVHELNEVGWIPSVVEHVWDVNPILDENSLGGEILKALFGYNGNPSLTEVVAYLGYYLVLAWVYRRQAVSLRLADATL